jgi:hypothetical protein
MRKTPLFACIAAIGAIAAAALLLTQNDTRSDVSIAKNVEASKTKNAENTAGNSSGHDHEVEALLIQLASTPGEQPHFDFNAKRFEEIMLSADNRYELSNTKLVLDASCAKRVDLPDPARSIELQLQQDYVIDGRQRVPDDVFFESLTQFFKVGESYYQLSAFAKPASRPPVYTIEFYRADDAGMQNGLLREAPPLAIGAQIDAPMVADIFSNVLRHYKPLGMVEGARLMDIRVAGREGQEDQAIRYFNGLPVQWVFSSGLCQMSAQQAVSHCRCLPDQEVLRTEEY